MQAASVEYCRFQRYALLSSHPWFRGSCQIILTCSIATRKHHVMSYTPLSKPHQARSKKWQEFTCTVTTRPQGNQAFNIWYIAQVWVYQRLCLLLMQEAGFSCLPIDCHTLLMSTGMHSRGDWSTRADYTMKTQNCSLCSAVQPLGYYWGARSSYLLLR